MNPALDKAALARLIPHSGSMCLLDAVLDHSANDICCLARNHSDPDHPLRRDDQLSALHLVEYAAQACAIHGALQADGKPQAGMLASVREVALHADRLDTLPGPLRVKATRRLARPEGSLYDFSVEGPDNELLGEGRLAISLRSPNGGL